MEARPPSGAHPPTGVQPIPAALTMPLTPFGEPIDNFSAAFLAKDPIKWHIQYWFTLFCTAMIRGEDGMLLMLRIEYEQIRTPGGIGLKVFEAWEEERDPRHERSRTLPWAINRHKEKIAMSGNKENGFDRDLDRMLADKGWKTRKFLDFMENEMTSATRAGDFETASFLCQNLCKVWPKLRAEEFADGLRAVDPTKARPKPDVKITDIIQAWNGVW